MDGTVGAEDFYRLFEQAYEDELAAIGRFNLVVVGDTGAGKSTLVNAVFGVDDAATGVGRPITPEIMGYEGPPPSRLRIFDTPGFEVGHSTDQLIAGLTALIQDRRQQPPSEHIHAVWFVINQNSHRIQLGHEKIIRALAALHLPPLMVLTHVELRQGRPQRSAIELAREINALALPLGARGNVFLVNSVVEEEGASPQHGLTELVNATVGQIPHAARLAFKVAQIVDLRLKRELALRHLKRARPFAFAAGAVPVPLADVAALMTVHANLLARIGAAYGLKLAPAQLAKLAALTAVIGGSAALASRRVAATAATWVATTGAERTAELAAREVAKIMAEEAGREAAKIAARKVAARKVAELVVDEAAQRIAAKTVDGVLNVAARKAVEEAGKETAKIAARKAVAVAAEHTGKEAAKVAARQAAKRSIWKIVGKAAPGVNAAIAVFNGTLCVGITIAVGHAWMKACEEMIKRPDLFANVAEVDVIALYNSFFKRRKSQPPTDDDLDAMLDADAEEFFAGAADEPAPDAGVEAERPAGAGEAA
ncbi:GTPase family protein [Dactylosporangium sp. CA-139066]|uniref:GTPase family protein n=1 Tax=Dactylosporangium sp. CA-139066 TaxID=3239930 RepID=UPI003D932249